MPSFAFWATLGTIVLQIAPALGEEQSVVTPSELKERNPAEASDVTVRGILLNKGSNYFTDRQLVLRDPHTGVEVYVKPWLPFSLPPPGSESSSESPSVQSDFLNKEVILEGQFANRPVKGVGTVGVIDVERAQVAGPGSQN